MNANEKLNNLKSYLNENNIPYDVSPFDSDKDSYDVHIYKEFDEDSTQVKDLVEFLTPEYEYIYNKHYDNKSSIMIFIVSDYVERVIQLWKLFFIESEISHTLEYLNYLTINIKLHLHDEKFKEKSTVIWNKINNIAISFPIEVSSEVKDYFLKITLIYNPNLPNILIK